MTDNQPESAVGPRILCILWPNSAALCCVLILCECISKQRCSVSMLYFITSLTVCMLVRASCQQSQRQKANTNLSLMASSNNNQDRRTNFY